MIPLHHNDSKDGKFAAEKEEQKSTLYSVEDVDYAIQGNMIVHFS
jgi:hypothetical protein